MNTTFKLHRKQGTAFQSKATELLFGGAAGGGKSHLLRTSAISWSYVIPNLQTYFFRRTYPDLWKNHMDGPTSFPVQLGDLLKAGLVKINYSKNIIEFWNNSKIHLCHCQHEKDIFDYQGAEIHILIIDELTHFVRKMYEFLRSRVRLGSLEIPEKYKGLFPRILTGSNPGNIGHNWVKQTFIDFAPPYAIKVAPKDDGGMLRQFIPSLLEDNPSMTENDPNYEDRLSGLGSPEMVRAMRYGDWDIVAGGMFDDVWNQKVHVIEPFDIPKTWRIDRSFDWGSAKPYSVGWWAESDGCDIKLAGGVIRSTKPGDLFRISELYGMKGKVNEGTRELATEVARKINDIDAGLKEKGFRVYPGPADTSIFDTDNGMCIADDMSKAPYFVAWTRADKRPGSRVNGCELVRSKLKNSITKDGPGLFIFNNCRQFIRTVPVLPRDEGKPDDVDCFVAGTKVDTPDGLKNIEDINKDDLVNTPLGFRRVLKAGIAGKCQTVIVKFSDGRTIEGTPDHKVFVEGQGLVALEDIKKGAEVSLTSWQTKKQFITESSIESILEEDTLNAVAATLKDLEHLFYTGKSGRTTSEKSPLSITYITKTGILKTTALKILNALKKADTAKAITAKEQKILKKLTMNGLERLLQNIPCVRMLKRCAETHQKENLRAMYVENNLQLSTLRKCVALRGVLRLLNEKEILKRYVRYAETLFTANLIPRKKVKLVVISVVGSCEEKTVYNLTTEQAHLFYVDGILVSNTDAEDHVFDETRYRISAKVYKLRSSQ